MAGELSEEPLENEKVVSHYPFGTRYNKKLNYPIKTNFQPWTIPKEIAGKVAIICTVNDDTFQTRLRNRPAAVAIHLNAI